MSLVAFRENNKFIKLDNTIGYWKRPSQKTIYNIYVTSVYIFHFNLLYFNSFIQKKKQIICIEGKLWTGTASLNIGLPRHKLLNK